MELLNNENSQSPLRLSPWLRKLILILSIILFNNLEAQEGYFIGLTITPAQNNIYSSEYNVGLENALTGSYGLQGGYSFKRFCITTGLMQLNQGADAWVEMASEQQPEGSTGIAVWQLRIRSITVPLNVDYSFIQRKKFSLFAGPGLYTSRVYSQQYQIPASTQIGNTPVFADVEVVDALVFQANLGLGCRLELGKRIQICCRPNLLCQVSKNKQEPQVYMPRHRLISYGLEFGFFVRLGKIKTETTQ